jgi:hypothetical protein
MFTPATPETATPEEVGQAILEAAHRAAEEEIAKLIQQRIVPDERRIKALEDEVARLRRQGRG